MVVSFGVTDFCSFGGTLSAIFEMPTFAAFAVRHRMVTVSPAAIFSLLVLMRHCGLPPATSFVQTMRPFSELWVYPDGHDCGLLLPPPPPSDGPNALLISPDARPLPTPKPSASCKPWFKRLLSPLRMLQMNPVVHCPGGGAVVASRFGLHIYLSDPTPAGLHIVDPLKAHESLSSFEASPEWALLIEDLIASNISVNAALHCGCSESAMFLNKPAK